MRASVCPNKQTSEINELTFNLLSIYSGAQGGSVSVPVEIPKLSLIIWCYRQLCQLPHAAESIALPLTPSLLTLSFLPSFK